MNQEVIHHYNCLIEENNDSVYDPLPLQRYMDLWDGQAFIEDLNLDRSKSVLEVGVGSGRLAKKVCGNCNSFTGIDIADKVIERAQWNLSEFTNKELICADFMTYNFERKFDVIYSSLTFMHIEDKAYAVHKIVSLLKENGRFVLSIEKTESSIIEYGSRIVHTYPDTPEEITKLIKKEKLRLTKQYDIEFAFVFVTECI